MNDLTRGNGTIGGGDVGSNDNLLVINVMSIVAGLVSLVMVL